MEYQKIRYFLKAAETMNFSTAAAEMYVSPQAFGKQIALLEAQMGFPLFERSTRKLKLTYEGEICLKRLKGLVLELEGEYEKLCEMGQNAKKRINIGFFNAMSRFNDISPVINGIITGFPNLEISTYMLELREIRKKLMNGFIDIAFTHYQGSDTDWQDCDIVKLKEKRADIIVAKNHVWAEKGDIEEIGEADMRQCDFVCMSDEELQEEDIFNIIPCRRKITVPNYDSMLITLKQPNIFTIAAEDDMVEPNLNMKHLPFSWQPFHFQVVMITKTNSENEIIADIREKILLLLETYSL